MRLAELVGHLKVFAQLQIVRNYIIHAVVPESGEYAICIGSYVHMLVICTLTTVDHLVHNYCQLGNQKMEAVETPRLLTIFVMVGYPI